MTNPYPYRIRLANLSKAGSLSRKGLATLVSKQLQQQGRKSSNAYGYRVRIDILEGRTRPATDVDNYAKPIIDAITQSGLLWKDDDQIEEMVIRRRRDWNCSSSEAIVSVDRMAGQHSGVPHFFRACCVEAKRGGQLNYWTAGFHLAIHLGDQEPYDLEEGIWPKEVERLVAFLESGDDGNALEWFCEHYPKCMKLVPARRRKMFIAGVRAAQEREGIGA